MLCLRSRGRRPFKFLSLLPLPSSSRFRDMSSERKSPGWAALPRSTATPRQVNAGKGFIPEGTAVGMPSPSSGNRSSQTAKFQRPNLRDRRPSVSLEKSPAGRGRGGRGGSSGRSESPERGAEKHAFDICCQPADGVFRLNRPLLAINKEKRAQANCKISCRELRPGMVLLEKFLSHSEQVTIIQECRKLGLGPGGFYQPGYRDGAKLHLQMMCLGKNWDPQTKQYHDIRSYDGAKPPAIPEEFKKLVERAMQASHQLLCNGYEGPVGDVLHSFAPDLCIVNFYSSSGCLGLHQDQDESASSLYKGLPVVSFSIGDAADFRSAEKRNDVEDSLRLNSGDVLIFGGKSRLVFHGVSKIYSGTAPESLLQETDLRPGRLNLTFRQY